MATAQDSSDLRCDSIPRAREILENLLHRMGGSLEPEHEPGLDAEQRQDEDQLRAVIAFLRAIETMPVDPGHRLRLIRAQRGFTQAQLADKLDVRPGRVSRIEKGLDPFPTEWAGLLAALLDVPADTFMWPRRTTH